MGDFAAFDASWTDGLHSAGYFGAVFDGRYVYFSPEQIKSGGRGADNKRTVYDDDQHGVVLRYDTHAPFEQCRQLTNRL